MDRISTLELEITEIRKTLNVKEKELYDLKKKWVPLQQCSIEDPLSFGDCQSVPVTGQAGKLPRWAIERYSRQILLPNIGVQGQEKLCAAKVLIVGAGGLGCPAAMFLAGAGVGELGIVDYDTVEITNIHRQLLHGESDENMNKVDSAADSLRNLNSRIKITPYKVSLDASNALEIATKYDLILDCTDNVPTRLLLNDLAVLHNVPLISGSALKMEGQLTIYAYKADNNSNEKEQLHSGPCYRCLFPAPPPPETVGSCSAQGVAGPVCGLIGTLQALEAIKYIVGHTKDRLLVGRMLLFDGEDSTFRTVRLRPRNPSCAACGDNPTITQLIDYEAYCQMQAKEKKRQEARLKSQKRREEKQRRMKGRSYFGFRLANEQSNTADHPKWIQDVPKSERKIGLTCKSNYCTKHPSRQCSEFSEDSRKEIFSYFWNELNWSEKRKYVRSLIDSVPPKNRRLKIKNEVSRKQDTKVYNLKIDGKKLQVCRVMFLNTLGVKEAMVRYWLANEETTRAPKKPIKALNVDSYIDSLPKSPPRCRYCRDSSEIQYVAVNNIKNVYQLYNQYVVDMKNVNISPASRKTFTKIFQIKNIRIFKPKKVTDVCDLISQHNISNVINHGVQENNLQNINNINDNEYQAIELQYIIWDPPPEGT